LNMRRYDLTKENRVHDYSNLNQSNAVHTSSKNSNNHVNDLLGIDTIRSASMVSWTMLVSTPFFMQVFRLFEKYLPKGRAGSLPMRVILTTSCAIPINFAFFVYATFSHSLLEEFSNRSANQNYEAKDFNTLFESIKVEASYKIEQEYVNTVKASITCWTPINFINQAFVPVHSRTMFMNICQMFWNCYLSVAQHRDITLPETPMPMSESIRPNVLIQASTSFSSQGPDKAPSV